MSIKNKLTALLIAILSVMMAVMLTGCGANSPTTSSGGGATITGTVQAPGGVIAYSKPTFWQQIAGIAGTVAHAVTGVTWVGPGVVVTLKQIDNTGNPLAIQPPGLPVTAVTGTGGAYSITLPAGINPSSDLIITANDNPANMLRIRAFVTNSTIVNVNPATEATVQMIANGNNNLANFTVAEITNIYNLINIASKNTGGTTIPIMVSNIKAAAQLDPAIDKAIVAANAGIPANGGGAPGTISGTVLSTSNVPIFGATVVANQNIGVISDSMGNYLISGLGVGVNAKLSAAAAGYIAQTIDQLPTGTVQPFHLSSFTQLPPGQPIATPLKPATTNNTLNIFVTTSAGTPLANTLVYLCPENSTGNINMPGSGFVGSPIRSAFTDATGIASFTAVADTSYYMIYVPVLTANAANIGVSILAESFVGVVWADFTPVTANLAGIKTIQKNIGTSPNATAPLTINIANLPAGFSTNLKVYEEVLVNGVPTGQYVVIAQGPMTGTSITIPNAVGGVAKHIVQAYTGDALGYASAEIIQTGVLQNTTCNLSYMNLPALAVTTPFVAANNPTFGWTAIPGAVQYQLIVYDPNIIPGATIPPNSFIGWEAVTSALAIQKPIFAPANNGNFLPNYQYRAYVTALDYYMVGNGPAYALNPMMSSGGPSAFMANPNVGVPTSHQVGDIPFWWDNNRIVDINNNRFINGKTYRASSQQYTLPVVQ